MSHMDHHTLDTVLECIKCKKSVFPIPQLLIIYKITILRIDFRISDFRINVAGCNSVCQFYSHSCHEETARSCVFCEEMNVMRELGPLPLDSGEVLADKVVDLFSRMARYNPSKEARGQDMEEEQEVRRELGVGRLELVFMDYLKT